MRIGELLRIIWARRWRFITVFATVVLAALALSLLLPKVYVGQVSLIVNSKNKDPLTGMLMPPQLLPSEMATQMDIIASHNVALKVVDKYKLTRLPDLQAQFQDDTDGRGSIRDWIADKLIKKLDVVPSRESNVINIQFSSTDPNFSAELANAFADAYIQTSLELNMDPARRQAGWFDAQLQDLRKSVQVAQQRLADFQQKKTIVSTDDRLDVETGRLAEIETQLVAAQSAMYDAQTRQKQMNQALERNQLEELPDILGNGLLQGMKADLARVEGKLSDVAARYGKNHPQYLSASAEVRTLQSKFTKELSTAKGSINQAAQIAQRRTTEVQRALDSQKARILELKAARDGADTLNREVENAQRTYDASLQRANQVRMESQLDQSTVAVLNPAIPPTQPARPRLLLNLALAIVLGAMLGAALAFTAEISDRRVRGSRDLAATVGIVVLAEIPKGRIRARRRKAASRARTLAAPSLRSA